MVLLTKSFNPAPAGNMKSGPKPGDETTRVHYIYDPWNRLTEVRADDSGSAGALIAKYSYDGLNRRIEKEVTAGSVDTHYYYNTSWQCLEERRVDGSGVTTEANQYVWSARYIDSPIVRFHDDNGDGDLLDAGDTTRYYTTDANHNVTAVIDAATGNVVTRYAYTPYGDATAYDTDWSNPTTPTEDGPLYCGYFFDAESELYQVRNRYYDSSIGGFVSRDPIGYRAGDVNLYRYVANRPTALRDPLGTYSTLMGCLKSPAALSVCIQTGVVSKGDVIKRFMNIGQTRVVKQLVKMGGEVVKCGGKGSHIKVKLGGETFTIADPVSRGVAKQILDKLLDM